MKTIIRLIFVMAFLTGTSNAGILGDINNDGKVDLAEAIFALKVAVGQHPGVNDSCAITGQGDWQVDAEYNLCDTVRYNGTYYLATAGHTASQENQPPGNLWTILAIKGDSHFILTDTNDSIFMKGDVGIGLAYPQSKLQVRGDTNDGTSSALKITNLDNDSIFTVKSDGKVGIGTNAPMGELHVSKLGGVLGLTYIGDGPETITIDTSGYVRNDSIHYIIRIDGANQSSGNHPFSYSTDNGQTWSSPLFTYTSGVDLGNGVIVGFPETAANSYKANDTWEFTVSKSYPNGLVVRNGMVGIGTTEPKVALDVKGAVKIGSTESCDAPSEGAIRYNQDFKEPEFCNGSEWRRIGRLVVRDANGKNLGDYFESYVGYTSDDDKIFAWSETKYLFRISMVSGTLDAYQFAYTSSDCSGQPYSMDIKSRFYGQVGYVFGHTSGENAYYIPKKSNRINIAVHSLRGGGNCESYNGTSDAYPVYLNDPNTTGIPNPPYQTPITVGW